MIETASKQEALAGVYRIAITVRSMKFLKAGESEDIAQLARVKITPMSKMSENTAVE